MVESKYQLNTTVDVARTLAGRAKTLRLQKKWKRATLAARSGVSESSLRRFEQTGKVSLENFLNILLALGRLDEMHELLQPPAARTIEDLMKKKEKLPQRGSI